MQRALNPGPRAAVAAGAAAAWALAALAAVLLLRGSFCAFTWDKFTLTDYGKYTNMLWNCGHGMPFRMLVDDSYLRTHLSFSLALLGPLFRLWNHPFLPAAVQWAGGVGGGFLLAATVWRRTAGAARALLPPALAFAFLAHPYTQAVLLSEFHGVGLYLLAVPWLYATLVFRRPWTALPLAFLLGLREDAAFIVIPMLLYFAVRDRWRAGYVYAGIALLYAVLALKVLFPLVAGTAFSEVRVGLSWSTVLARLSDVPPWPRLRGLVWVLLPILPFLRRGWRPLLVFPSAALLLTVASPYPAQYGFSHHYPAGVVAGLFPALAEVLARPAPRPVPARSARTAAAAAAWLVGITLGAHLFAGYLPGGGRTERSYARPDPEGIVTLSVARELPARGLLVCSRPLAGYVANRADLLPWELYDPARHPLGLAFFRLDELAGHNGHRLRALLADPGLGVRAWRGDVVVLERGRDPRRNAEVLAALDRMRRTVPLGRTLKHGGDEQWIEGRLVRHAAGDPRRAGLTVAYGRAIPLGAGSHRAVLTFRSGPAARPGAVAGRFALYAAGAAEPLATAPLPAEAGTANEFATVEQSFRLKADAAVEPRIESGAAELWLASVEFF